MDTQRKLLCWAVALGLAVFASAQAAADRKQPPRNGDGDDGGDPGPPRDLGGLIQLEVADEVVAFRQVQWDLDLLQQGLTDWGDVAVNPAALSRFLAKHAAHPPKATGLGNLPEEEGGPPAIPPGHAKRVDEREAYLNVLLHTPGENMPSWVVENLHFPASMCVELPSDEDDRQPVCRYLDLMPTHPEFDGPIPLVQATVLLSQQPLPPTAEVLIGLLRAFDPTLFDVEAVVENAEGMDPDPLLATFPPRQINPDLPLGYPPAALTPEIGPIQDLLFPNCVYQDDAPNIECAKNQCVPMAQSNALQYLEDRYDGPFLWWRFNELPVPGIGKVSSVGDIVFWEPVPIYSLVANVDFFTRRAGVYDPDSGSGSSICQLYQGLFWYLELAEPFTLATFLHQGTNAPTIGEGTTCDTGPYDFDGRVSFRAGENPTFAWIFEQLSLGRAVTICFGRYDVDGNRTSGHCVRVWGACNLGFTKKIYTLDDGNQGSNNVGLRTQNWVVADTGSPGMPGVPDGRLNMDGMSWEIEFANSIQAYPTPVISLIAP